MSAKIVRITELSIVTLESNPPKYNITAIGFVNSGGWSNPRLEPVGEVLDGIQNYDFLIDPPNSGVIVPQVISSHKATILLGHLPALLKGIRVHSATNQFEKLFDGGMIESLTVDGGVDVWPWSVSDDGGVDILPWSVKQIPASTQISLRDLVGRTIRVVRPGDHVTQEVQAGRVTIHLDENSKAVDVVIESGNDI